MPFHFKNIEERKQVKKQRVLVINHTLCLCFLTLRSAGLLQKTASARNASALGCQPKGKARGTPERAGREGARI